MKLAILNLAVIALVATSTVEQTTIDLKVVQ
jgi:hypothetical protein